MKFTIRYYKEKTEWLAECKEVPRVRVRGASEEEATERIREALEEHVAALLQEYAAAREHGGERAEELESRLRALGLDFEICWDDEQE